MRLIDVKTFKIKEFAADVPYPYAILSHCWGNDEVSFQDMKDLSIASKKSGFSKITRCCKAAGLDGFTLVWVDTCCIDKSSSSELSEAINSMYQWYCNAGVCYVYLPDVPDTDCPTTTTEVLSSEKGAFMNSSWFSRGWTLQELIAPSSVIFYDMGWVEIGTKSSLRDLITRATNVPTDMLMGYASLNDYSVAQKMSWASRRQTTRVEDIAYCLMGIFQVNMPMLYGEGRRAFFRLQEEILKNSGDHSIFAWDQGPPGDGNIFADSPDRFSASRDIVCDSVDLGDHLFEISSKGLRLPMTTIDNGQNQTIHGVILNCARSGNTTQLLAVQLMLDSSSGGNMYKRIGPRLLLVEKRKLSSCQLVYPVYVQRLHRVPIDVVNHYAAVLIETSGLGRGGLPLDQFPRSGLKYYRRNLSLFLGDIASSPRTVLACYSWPDNAEFILAFVYKPGGDDKSDSLIIHVAMVHDTWIPMENDTLATVYGTYATNRKRIESGSEPVSSLNRRTKGNLSDRMRWERRDKRYYLDLVTKRKIVDGFRRTVVSLSCCPKNLTDIEMGSK